VTIATVLFCSLLLLLLMGAGAKNGPAAAIIIGSVVCCAASIAGDNLQDLKAGYLVGATPWRQQVMQIVGTVSAALVMAPILTLLLKAYGFAGHSSATDSALAAPQAHLMASVAQGVFEGGLPWNFIFIGMLVAVAVILLDSHLERRGSSFRAPVLAVAIGFYLPFKLEVPIIVGAVIHEIVRRRRAAMDVSKGTLEESGQRGLLFASGLITGEALIGIALAIPIVISSRQDVLAVLDEPIGPWPGLLLMAGVGYWLYRTASRKIKN
jgi:putative OPT family oligopeptide transporter